MKIFKVSIDNDPGGWKSGPDHSELVIAETQKEAIEKVKKGWGNTWDIEDGNNCLVYGIGKEMSKPYISKDGRISAMEVKFKGLEITTVREAKLKRIIKDE